MPLKTETVERSVKRIGKVHLKALGKIARDDISSLLSKSDRFRRAYRGRLFAITLCQGAATHYLDGTNGVKDFDVWSWWAERDPALSRYTGYKFPYRRFRSVDSARYDRCFEGFGVRANDADDGYEGRRVDLLMREIPDSLGATGISDPVLALQEYLTKGKTDSARLLSAKPLIGIWPESILGIHIWTGS